MKNLTKKLKETQIFIENYIVEHDISPTEQEIADGINIASRGVAHRYVSKLEEYGIIERIPNKRRNIKLTYDPDLSNHRKVNSTVFYLAFLSVYKKVEVNND